MAAAPPTDGDLAPLRALGYDASTWRITGRTIADLAAGVGPAVAAWAADLAAHRTANAAHFRSHISDFLRLALLHAYGGTYIDLDAVLVRPLAGLRNAVGLNFVGKKKSFEWAFEQGLV